MAVVPTFKQQCPSCEAMVSIKETMIGKKVECTKCKDKFIAEPPHDEDDEPKAAKKETKTVTKKNTTVTKSGVGGKPSKADIVEEDDDEGDEDEKPQVKSGKGKSGANGKPKKADSDEDEAEEDEAPGNKKKKKAAAAGSNKKLYIMAGVAVGVLLVAFLVIFRDSWMPMFTGPRGPQGRQFPQDVKNNPDANENDKKVPPPIDKGIGTTAVALTDIELAKLSNLLPPDTEHVFRLSFANLFAANSPLKSAVFDTPAGLNDSDLRKQLGFSLLAIDDLITAEKYTSPGWKFTVIHFKEFVSEDALKTALKLKAVPKAIEGQTYYKTTEAHPYFDQLGRYSFGIPIFFRAFDQPSERPSLVRIHNPQTLIVGDEAPVMAFLAAKGQFPQQSAPPAVSIEDRPAQQYSFTAFVQGVGPQGGPLAIAQMKATLWEGTEDKTSKIRLAFDAKGNVSPFVDSEKLDLKNAATTGNLNFKGQTGTMTLVISGKKGLSYDLQVDLSMKKIWGSATDGKASWPVELTYAGTQKDVPSDPKKDPPPKTDPGPKTDPLPKGDPPTITPGASYLTIKSSLKAVLDRLEARSSEGKHKIFFSSATDMNAGLIELNVPELKDIVVRKPRQFWDVTLMLNERKARIRYLGAALIQHDTLRYQLRNELACSAEIDAQEFQQDLGDRAAPQIARFIQAVVGHPVRVIAAAKKGGAGEGGREITASQIAVVQRATTVDFALDLLLDPAALKRVQGISALKASTLNVEMASVANASLRHVLSNAGKELGLKGLSKLKVEADRYPPGAFPRPKKTPTYIESEPKNRISWMAGLLPYMGHAGLFERIQFEQSWRDSGNWLAGHTIVPQFLDPSYPDFARQTTIGDLPLDFAATHYVGIAGVGLDAASYRKGDPATEHKRGVLSYDGSATLDEIRNGRGLANTMFMIQVPYDTPTGVSPWVAGGGNTLRGVPEKKSIAPFVLSSDKNGNPIEHQKKKGTYALMTDGSVRFIAEDVSDDVFKAMATIKGPAPAAFDLDKDASTPLIPPPEPAKADKKK